MNKKILKKILFAFLIFLTLSGIFALFMNPTQEVESISLTKLSQEINKENVEEIKVAGESVTATYNDGTKVTTIKEPQGTFSETMVNYGADRTKLQSVNIIQEDQIDFQAWLTPILLVLPLLLFGFFFYFMLKRAKMGANKAMDFSKAKAKLFGAEKDKDEEDTSFEDVAGLKEPKSELREIVEFLKEPKKFLKMGARIPNGVLLLGPPGVGKTLLARAVAGEAGVPFFSISGSEFVEMFVGVGASRVRDLFKKAKENSPAILFIDELDAVGRKRGTGIGGGHDEREQTLNQILTEMDGFEKDTKVIVLAATNRGDVLDPALLRPGRFDRKVNLDLPDINDREKILKIHCREKPLSDDVNLREIAERTPGFSGADLANLINEAAILAARREKEKVYQDELLESIEKVLLGPERESFLLSDEEKKVTAYHEAGHALLASLLPGTEAVRKVSIVARGGAGGYTLKMPKEEKKLRKKSEFINEMTTLLGGYCAEQIKFGEITTGAAQDIDKASQIARKLVKKYGMSALGPISFNNDGDKVFLGDELTETRNYSEEVAAKIDKEIKKLVNKAKKQSTKLLKENKELLEDLAETLIEKETIERKEFEEIVEKHKED